MEIEGGIVLKLFIKFMELIFPLERMLITQYRDFSSSFHSRHNTHTAYLSTKGQEKFYMKLGYETCEPIPLYGGFPLPANQIDMTCKKMSSSPPKGPVPPPLPPPIDIQNGIRLNTKTFMMKTLQGKRQTTHLYGKNRQLCNGFDQSV